MVIGMITENEFLYDKAYRDVLKNAPEDIAYYYAIEALPIPDAKLHQLPAKSVVVKNLIDDHKRLMSQKEKEKMDREKYLNSLPFYKRYIVEQLLKIRL